MRSYQDNPQNKELERRLNELYQKFEDSLNIKSWSRNGFITSAISFNPTLVNHLELDKIEEEFGSVENYWKHAVQTVVSTQETTNDLWKELTEICADLLEI